MIFILSYKLITILVIILHIIFYFLVIYDSYLILNWWKVHSYVLENVFGYVGVNVRVGGRYSSIIVPLDTLKPSYIAPWYVDNVITDAGRTPEKVPSETVGDILP